VKAVVRASAAASREAEEGEEERRYSAERREM
jgi:hypothetical protein